MVISDYFFNLVDKVDFLQETIVDKFNFLQEHDMKLKHPATYYPELSDTSLQAIAVALLDVRFSTCREMNSPYDDNYTRETAVFGRSKNMLIEMALKGQFGTTLLHAGMDVTFKIGQVPCRFFRDDPNSPEKAGFFKRNAVDDLFSIDDQHPVLWRFIVEKALTEDDEDRVFFVGYNAYQEKISEWVSQASSSVLRSVDQDTPQAKEIPPASVDIRERDIKKPDDLPKTGSNE